MTFSIWKQILSKEFPVCFSYEHNLNNFLQTSFTPYQNNGGTIVSLNFQDLSIVASDTRIISGFSIPSRETTRIIKISENILLSTTGMRADMLILQEKFKQIVNSWEIDNIKSASVSNGAYVLSSILYSRRFFPFYTFNILTGKELDGRVLGFSFDAVGSFEICQAISSGSGQHFIQPILDSQFKHPLDRCESKKSMIIKNIMLIKHLFLKASKRNIEIGDGIQIFIFTRKGILVENNILRYD